MKQQVFYCDSCGLPVPAGSGICPHCGGSFEGVRCPSCHYQGQEKEFKKGCPACGYLATDPPGKGRRADKDLNELPEAPRPPKPEKKKKSGLPGWFYTFSLLGLLFLLVLFLGMFVFQIFD